MNACVEGAVGGRAARDVGGILVAKLQILLRFFLASLAVRILVVHDWPPFSLHSNVAASFPLSALPVKAGADQDRYLARVDAREERLANNEVLFREINERIADVAGPHTPFRDDHVYEFLCECSNVGCDLRLPLTLSVYEGVRKEPTHFVVAPGHELPEIEIVITHADGYQIVKKHGEAAALAEEKDPRA